MWKILVIPESSMYTGAMVCWVLLGIWLIVDGVYRILTEKPRGSNSFKYQDTPLTCETLRFSNGEDLIILRDEKGLIYSWVYSDGSMKCQNMTDELEALTFRNLK